MVDNIGKGELGENIAERFLSSKGYKILERNFRIRTGEIDIIALKKEILAFIEVKTRTSLNYGYPCESVTKIKQNKIIQTASYYIHYKRMHRYQPRFDILEVYLGGRKGVNHIKNAFYP